MNENGYIKRILTSFIDIPSKICISVYFSGCDFKCNGCHNLELQDLHSGIITSSKEIIEKINNNKLCDWVCFIGGEPFYQYNFLYNLCNNIKNKKIGIYTGNTYNDIIKNYKDILNIDNLFFIKCGKFDINKVNIEEYPITSNQEVYIKNENKWNKILNRKIDFYFKLNF